MNRMLIMLLLLLVGGSVVAQSARTDPFEKPERDLSKRTLTEMDLYAYQNRANQKVAEFFQYLEVMADYKHNDPVRDKAEQMAARQFESTAILKLPETEKVNEYLHRCRQGTQYKAVDSMIVSQPLTLEKSGRYQSKVWVKYRMLDSEKEVTNPEVGAEEFTVVLMQKEKRFGSTIRLIWELYLNGIEVVD